MPLPLWKRSWQLSQKKSLVGFGTFERTERAAHTGKNPRTGEILEVPASRAVKFKVGAEFKKKVNA